MLQKLQDFYNSLELCRGGGSKVWDKVDKEYIDFSCGGAFCAAFGHDNPHIHTRLSKPIHPGVSHSYRFQNSARNRYLARLCDLTGYEHAVMFSTGTEATEAAWRVMRKYRRKDGILGMDGAFHGKTLGAQIMAGKSNEDGTLDYRYGEPSRACGLIMEPYRAVDACFRSDEEIARVNHMVRDYDLLLTLDEIQGGFFRTGKLFGYQHYVATDGAQLLKPDFVCIGKAAFNGFPASVLLGPDWMDDPRFELSSTHGGHPWACAAGMGVLDTIGDPAEFENGLNNKAQVFLSALETMGVEYNHKGMVAVVIFKDAETAMSVARDCMARGLLVIPTGSNTIKIAPPLTISYTCLDGGLKVLAEVMNDLKT